MPSEAAHDKLDMPDAPQILDLNFCLAKLYSWLLWHSWPMSLGDTELPATPLPQIKQKYYRKSSSMHATANMGDHNLWDCWGKKLALWAIIPTSQVQANFITGLNDPGWKQMQCLSSTSTQTDLLPSSCLCRPQFKKFHPAIHSCLRGVKHSSTMHASIFDQEPGPQGHHSIIIIISQHSLPELT